jgi:hypothetical protein
MSDCHDSHELKLKSDIYENLSEEIAVVNGSISPDQVNSSLIVKTVDCTPIHMTVKDFFQCFYNKLGRFKWSSLAKVFGKTRLNIPAELESAYYESGGDAIRDITTLPTEAQIELSKSFLFLQKALVNPNHVHGRALTCSELLFVIKSKGPRCEKIFTRMVVALRCPVLNVSVNCVLHFKLSDVPHCIKSKDSLNALVKFIDEDDDELECENVTYEADCEAGCDEEQSPV